jgi:uncharacterized 2Fe-2S/4Fe-4S cluster protein (DUF4445 family)
MVSEDKPVSICRVHFDPDGVSIDVPTGTTLLEAAQRAGVPIDSVCGGAGRCGRCKVRVTGSVSVSGEEPSPESRSGKPRMVLACMGTITGDVNVHVPESSRIGIHQILEASEHVELKTLSPLVRKVHLHLPKPTLEDNLSDLDRIRRSLLNAEDRSAKIGLPVLRTIPRVVREKDWEITLSIAETTVGKRIVKIEPGDTTDSMYGIAVDIGTTTVVLRLIDMVTGKTLTTESTYNKQIVCGEDVLTRIFYAEEHGTSTMTKLIIQTIDFLISEACEHASKLTGKKIRPTDILSASISGNPAMIHFFLMLDTSNMRLEPYIPVANLIPFVHADDIPLNINPNSLVYICPGRASYIGGDVLADVLASGMHLSKKLSLLIDVGTNGEVVLGNKDWMVCCSCSAGPAFEGGEVSCGMRAMQGAIDRISITRSGDVRFHTIGDVEPLGICGSGLIDLISELFVHDYIDRRGVLNPTASKRIRKLESGESAFYIAHRGKGKLVKDWGEQPAEILITDTDIQNILRTKAAIYSGCSVLLKSLEYDFEDVSQVIIAGGFGRYLNIRKAITIGLLPDIDLKKYRFIGNGALEGARLTLLSSQKRNEILDIYRKMTYFELSVSALFFEEFSSALFLPHTDIERFPSVKSFLNKEHHDER